MKFEEILEKYTVIKKDKTSTIIDTEDPLFSKKTKDWILKNVKDSADFEKDKKGNYHILNKDGKTIGVWTNPKELSKQMDMDKKNGVLVIWEKYMKDEELNTTTDLVQNPKKIMSTYKDVTKTYKICDKCGYHIPKSKGRYPGKCPRCSDVIDKNDIEVVESAEDGDKEEYTKFFNKILKKYNVESPEDLSDEDRKKFYDEVDKGWKADHEGSDESVNEKKLNIDKDELLKELQKLHNKYTSLQHKHSVSKNKEQESIFMGKTSGILDAIMLIKKYK